MNKIILISLLILVAFIATILARTFILKSSIKKPINKANFDASTLYEKAPENEEDDGCYRIHAAKRFTE